MLYVFTGNDFKKKRKGVEALLLALKKKRPEAEVFKLDESMDPRFLDELLGSTGLFDAKHIVVLDSVLSVHGDVVLTCAKEMKESENVFIVVEEKILSEAKKKLERHAESYKIFDKKEEKKESFNAFTLTDALISRDRKNLWTLYMKALRRGKAPEELHGILFWQAKSMKLAHITKTPSEAGLKPFVYTKSKRGSERYSKEELDTLLWNLVDLYHEARRAEPPLEIRLEEMILTL